MQYECLGGADDLVAEVALLPLVRVPLLLLLLLLAPLPVGLGAVPREAAVLEVRHDAAHEELLGGEALCQETCPRPHMDHLQLTVNQTKFSYKAQYTLSLALVHRVHETSLYE